MSGNRITRKKVANSFEKTGENGSRTELKTTQAVFCPKCHKKHCSEYVLINKFICCECGCNFYVFADKGLQIIIPAQEAKIDQVVRAMRRFVVMTGRCQDIDPELLGFSDEEPDTYLRERDLQTELAKLLEEYQVEYFGDCFITNEVVDSICMAFGHNADVQLKKQKDGVDICEMKKPKRCTKPRQSERILKYNASLVKKQGSTNPPPGDNKLELIAQ